MCTHSVITRNSALTLCRTPRMFLYNKNCVSGWIGPFPLTMFLDTADSFSRGNFKTNCEQTKYIYIICDKTINGSKLLSFHYVKNFISNKLFYLHMLIHPKTKIFYFSKESSFEM